MKTKKVFLLGLFSIILLTKPSIIHAEEVVNNNVKVEEKTSNDKTTDEKTANSTETNSGNPSEGMSGMLEDAVNTIDKGSDSSIVKTTSRITGGVVTTIMAVVGVVVPIGLIGHSAIEFFFLLFGPIINGLRKVFGVQTRQGSLSSGEGGLGGNKQRDWFSEDYYAALEYTGGAGASGGLDGGTGGRGKITLGKRLLFFLKLKTQTFLIAFVIMAVFLSPFLLKVGVQTVRITSDKLNNLVSWMTGL